MNIYSLFMDEHGGFFPPNLGFHLHFLEFKLRAFLCVFLPNLLSAVFENVFKSLPIFLICVNIKGRLNISHLFSANIVSRRMPYCTYFTYMYVLNT